MNTLRCVALAIFGLLASQAHAQDVPLSGLVTNTVDRASLQYTCTKSSERDLQCDFVQVGIRRDANPDDLDKELGTARDEFRQGKIKLESEECGLFKQILLTMQGKPATVDPEVAKAFLGQSKPQERADGLRIVSALAAFCEKPDEQKLTEVVRATHDKKVRTCKVFSHSFSQTLRRTTLGGPWTVVPTPTGECGVVNVSRFEKADEKGLFWNYFSRKVITNPSGSSLIGMKCSDLDQREYKYQWQTETRYEGCDYISFGY